MNDLMICNYNKCQKFLLDPVILPCSNNVCKTHVTEMIKEENGEQFECFVCKNQHEIPKEGFILNNFITKVNNFNYHLNENAKQVADVVAMLKYEIKVLEELIQDPEEFISDHISTIRNQVNLEREKRINEINNLSDKMIKKLNKYQDECKENIKNLKQSTKKIETHLHQIADVISNIKDELRIPNICKTGTEKLIKSSNELLNDIKVKYLDFRNNLFMNQSWTFDKMNVDLHSICFKNKNFLFNTTNFRPLKLKLNQAADLIELCEFDIHQQFYLLYKASRDGFSSGNFHSKCDGIPNTLIIIKVKDNSNVFGGFTSVSWDSSSDYKSDTKAFIFSLINQDNMPLKLKIADTSKAIVSNCDYGPTFGYGHDLFISNNSNKNKESFSDLGSSYMHNLYPYGTSKAKNYLAGSHIFSTEEIEVYYVI